MSINSRLLPRAVAIAAISVAALTTTTTATAQATPTPSSASPSAPIATAASDDTLTSVVYGTWRFAFDVAPAAPWDDTEGTQTTATVPGESWIEIRGTDSWCYDMKDKQPRSPKNSTDIVRCG